ncbi:hypothetical protein STPH1_4231 [Streptomyces sp. OM5714]|nr:hypothetical protein STPH1_4231 [Streptomyces sp. OM5714]
MMLISQAMHASTMSTAIRTTAAWPPVISASSNPKKTRGVIAQSEVAVTPTERTSPLLTSWPNGRTVKEAKKKSTKDALRQS